MSDTILAPLPIELEPWRTRAATIAIDNDQWIYRFANGYGASVVAGPYTYGGPEGMYELAVLAFNGDEWHLTYDTPVTDDVIGWLDVQAVASTLAKIAALAADREAYDRAKKRRDDAREYLRKFAAEARGIAGELES